MESNTTKYNADYQGLYQLSDQQWDDIQQSWETASYSLGETNDLNNSTPWIKQNNYPFSPHSTPPYTPPNQPYGHPQPTPPLTPTEIEKIIDLMNKKYKQASSQSDSDNSELQEQIDQLKAALEEVCQQLAEIKAGKQEELKKENYPLLDVTEIQPCSKEHQGTYFAHGECTNCLQKVILRIHLGHEMPGEEAPLKCPRCLVEKVVGKSFVGIESEASRKQRQPVKDNLLY